MATELSPQRIAEVVEQGQKRLKNFRAARLHFLRDYVGQYYDRTQGEVGSEPLNLIFNAVRALVPNLVMNFPKHRVHTQFLAHQQYGELLELALDQHSRKIDIKNVYRQVLVDAIFTLGIMKTGLADSGSVVALDDLTEVDPGEVFTQAVSFDRLVVDPNSRGHLFHDAAFIGDILTVPRETLLESGLYNNELVERLPTTSENSTNNERRADELARRGLDKSSKTTLRDEVEIIELWVPHANVVLTVPAERQVGFNDFLRIDDYYGPDTGPYTFLALSPPVSDNPLPVPMVGIWRDLHVLGNRMAKKIVNQAERQKDVIFYRRSAADDAEEARRAVDGDAIAVDDPDAITVRSFGGQKVSNETQISTLLSWFNQMAANPDQLAGKTIEASSATEARILNQNTSIGLEDMRDLIYHAAATEAGKRAWYFHTDPLIEVPLIRREMVPEPSQIPGLPSMRRPEDTQVFLTPEVRRGDWLDFTFSIEPESMSRKDGESRIQKALNFATQVLPAAAQAAQTAQAMGVPFNFSEFVTLMAKDMGIDWMDRVWFDPDFQQRMLFKMQSGPQAENSRGQLNGGNADSDPLAAILQNGQPGQVQGGAVPEATQFNQEAQLGANEQQSALRPPSPGGFF